jgi:hypothetical protein
LEHRITICPESEDNKRLPKDRVLRIKGENLQSSIWPVSLLDETLELLIHHRVIADPALQDRFIEHDRQLELFAIQHLLALHADFDQSPDHTRRDWFDPAVAADYVSGISFRLQ